MNCTTCGANLPPGATACPLCGTPTPYNAGRPGSSPQYDPTVAVPQAGPGGSPHQDPTLPAQPYGGTPPPPSTAYGSPGYGTPPPPPNPYETPSYNAPPQQQNYYGAPPQQQGGYVVPPPQQGGMYGTPQPPRRRSRLGLILGIIALVLIVACAGISFAVYQGVKQAGNTVISSNATSTAEANATSTSSATTPTTSTNTTPTTSTSGNTGPSGTTIDPTAAGIITNTKMASAVDSNYNPTKVTDTFVTKQTIYATFKIDTNAPDGYVQGKWYADGKYAFSSKALAVKGDFLGYLSAEYNIATQGAVELYWCTQSNCSDGKLADVANFTVTTSGMHLTQPPALAFMDINRP
ncbi:MAG: hypothetical protein AUG45_00790 [Ktedonobacter sp. 13_1_20CM_3_54_15]|nr:MAG: hypothetical protein AUH05_14430 [Ktedonobacter sp. 13_2_20CM_53_11]OLB57519.1 MAG: hypothetical protein AUI01_04370 [Ktedonobacter sp. 13_2_20CM_2_56_8]OLE35819.1 MAG: hypothetical protein AUG45_00790 [Ktedonobacter sp. 13_1_20CM_3_54_15]